MGRRIARAGATAGIVHQPTPWTPPAPPVATPRSGYEIRLHGRDQKLLVVRHNGASVFKDGAEPSGKVLGSFDLKSLENGLVRDAWNIVRVLLVGGKITVWFNPMYPETGFVGNISDSSRKCMPLCTRRKNIVVTLTPFMRHDTRLIGVNISRICRDSTPAPAPAGID